MSAQPHPSPSQPHHPKESTQAELKGPHQVHVVSNNSFVDYRVLQTENYSISFTESFSMFTSDNGTLIVNPEGGSVILPEENQSKQF